MHALLSFYPAAILYAVFAVLKLSGQDWPTDLPGLHAGIGAMFLLFGASVCHLVFVCQLRTGVRDRDVLSQTFWVIGTIAFTLMFMDSAFGLHERYSGPLGVPEVTFFLIYGLMFVALAAANLKKVGLPFIVFFGAFGVASVGAILGDMSADHEGLLRIGGTAYSFEQFLETLGCLLLACAFATSAVRTLAPAPGPRLP